MIQGAPLQCCVAGSMPLAMRRRMVVGLRRGPSPPLRLLPRRVRHARHHDKWRCRTDGAGSRSLPVSSCYPDRSTCRSIENGGYRLVWHLSRQGTHEVNHFHVRCPSVRPARFRFTIRRVWSPPCQWTISSRLSPTMSTMISDTTVRMIFLRVSGVAARALPSSAKSRPSAMRRSRSATGEEPAPVPASRRSISSLKIAHGD